LPARLARLFMPTTWPSPETRWPFFSSVTSAPTSAISPANSWPTTIGTGIGRLGPLVPLVDVDVGAADAGLVDLHQHVLRADLRHRRVDHPDAGLGLGLGEGLHSVLLLSENADGAAGVGEGVDGEVDVGLGQRRDICVRMRALPSGTTG
jgi:hypothetical protein